MGDAGGAKFCAQCKRKRSRTQQAQGKSKRGKIMQAQGKGKSGELLQLSFDKGGIQPWSSSTAAMAMVGSGAETPSRTAHRQEGWPRSKASFDTDEAPRRRKPTSHPLQKRKRSDKDPGGPQTKRFGEGGMGSLLAGVELLAGFPLLKLPEELQMLVAAHVAAPLDRAALCIAVPPLGQKAIKGIPAYKGPLMSLGNRVLSGGAVGEAEVRRYVREFAPSEAVHPSLVLSQYTQLNALAGPGVSVRCVVKRARLEWRLESGAVLRVWMPRRNRNGDPGKLAAVRHYKGKRGAERLVSVLMSSGVVAYFEGKCGTEYCVRRELPTGAVHYYKGKRGAERVVSVLMSSGVVAYFEGKCGTEYMVRKELPSGPVLYYEGKAGAEHYVRREWPTGAVQYYEGKAGAEYLVRIKRCPSTGAVIYSSRG